MRGSLRIEGLKELDKLLGELPASTARRTSRKGMMAALEPVAAAARSMAPRGVEPKNARSADSIAVSDKLTRAQARAAARTDRQTPTMIHAYVGMANPLGHLIEFGSGPRRKKNGQYVGIMPAQPFMRPAWDANRAAVLASLTAHLRVEIDKVLARRAKRAARAAARGAR